MVYKQLFAGRLHVKMIELISDSAEKGDVLVDKGYHNRIGRLIGRVTAKRHHGGDRKNELLEINKSDPMKIINNQDKILKG